MTLNPILTRMYGDDIAASASADERAKLAQAQLVEQVLEDEGWDIEKLSGEQVLEVADLLFGADNDLRKLASADSSDEEKKKKEEEEAKEKEGKDKTAKDETPGEQLKMAEISGQVMAHAFAREIREMPDEMFGKIAGAADFLQKGLARGDKALQSIGSKVGGKVMNAATGAAHTPLSTNAARAVGAGTVAAGGAAAAGAAKAATGAGREKKASDEAIEQIARQQAAQLLIANGKDASMLLTPAEKIASAANQRTLEILGELGYTLKDGE